MCPYVEAFERIDTVTQNVRDRVQDVQDRVQHVQTTADRIETTVNAIRNRLPNTGESVFK